ncbi:hypothetical protein TD95_004869 [Thielaviopsis punctulata]|uniref:BZIP domain-containing protein n=1 Tax=Thielaviopsis punctulata TaxID=72032 RepID=A0A0F4ZFY1_9PEZI|nr:hypothetical protein TD95_004869 [Thielaviopsis punctulata]
MAEFHHNVLDPMGEIPVGGFPIQEKRTKEFLVCTTNAHVSNISIQDGNVPKRRGPKPDSKPALTRRQQLNRQAQRTHRERKEQYIRNLEEEVTKLRQLVVEAVHEKSQVMDLNRTLRETLQRNGIPIPPHITASLSQLGDCDLTNDTTSSVSGRSLGPSYASGMTAQTSAGSPTHGLPYSASDPTMGGYPGSHPHGPPPMPPSHKSMIDHEQAGIDFVLTYDTPQNRARAYLSPPPQ